MAVIVFITGCSQNLEGQNGCTQEGLTKAWQYISQWKDSTIITWGNVNGDETFNLQIYYSYRCNSAISTATI